MSAHAEIPYRKIVSFRRKVLRFYERHGRDLPWRRTTDPYRITVAEIMLQQTQVERVTPKYVEWIARWPDWRALAKASNLELLRAWSGLGYNRRALNLGKLARTLNQKHSGKLPHSPEELRELPGIGPYTSKAILIFAFNQPLATVDTNIRRVLLHEFDLAASIPKVDIDALACRVLPKQRSRDWHNGLMDYSRLVLRRRLASIPPISRQSRFEGSNRQLRGEIVRQLLRQKNVDISKIAKRLDRPINDINSVVDSMAKEGLVGRKGNRIELSDIL